MPGQARGVQGEEERAGLDLPEQLRQRRQKRRAALRRGHGRRRRSPRLCQAAEWICHPDAGGQLLAHILDLVGTAAS